jgi:hypothetical protein
MSPAHLTKRLFLATTRCPRKGWLLRNRTTEPVLSLGEQFRIEQGLEIGERARKLFPEGTLVEQKATEAAAKQTQELLKDPGVKTIFEATFLYNDYAAKADILLRRGEAWEMIEVKSGTAKKIIGKNGTVKNPATNRDLSDLIDDLAYTALISGKNGLDPVKIQLMLVAEKFQLGMAPKSLFETFDVTREVRDRAAASGGQLEPVADVLDGPGEPAFRLTGDCRKCEFFAHCIPLPEECSIFDIPRLQERQLLDLHGSGIVRIADMPEDYPLTDTQIVPVRCMRTGTVIVDDGLGTELGTIRWPAHYLDFETTQTAYPLYGNVYPYEKIATQYSVHTCSACGTVIRHREYLADPARDCRQELAEQLIRDLDGNGSVLSYSSYEEQVIRGLMERYPGLKDPLTAILGRIVDLLTCTKCVSHPGFRGSNSIKDVLPVLVPGMTYEGMAIANGEDASVTFAYMARGESGGPSGPRDEKKPSAFLRVFSPEECARTRQEMLRYCGQDTLAMVKIHEAFGRLAGTR